jgi:hypothetical protein
MSKFLDLTELFKNELHSKELQFAYETDTPDSMSYCHTSNELLSNIVQCNKSTTKDLTAHMNPCHFIPFIIRCVGTMLGTNVAQYNLCCLDLLEAVFVIYALSQMIHSP